jgi:hypothetical protein
MRLTDELTIVLGCWVLLGLCAFMVLGGFGLLGFIGDIVLIVPAAALAMIGVGNQRKRCGVSSANHCRCRSMGRLYVGCVANRLEETIRSAAA